MQGFHGAHEHWHLRNVVEVFRHPGGLGLGWGHGILREAGTLQNELAQLRDGDAFTWVALKDAAQDTYHLWGEWEDGLQEEWVLEIGLECGILDGGAFPWVATAGEVH
jgi:hypothetical protein